jgi:hypothetical protein
VSEKHFPPEDELMGCPTDLVAHISSIEAGWTLGKPWKARDEDEMERENQREVREMLARWAQHGITVIPTTPSTSPPPSQD